MPGSWRKRGKDSYQLEVCIGTNFKGKPDRYTKTVHCKSDKQAEKELALFYAECEAGKVSKGGNPTLEAFAARYLEYLRPRINRGISPSTYIKYKSSIRTHIAPVIGKNKLSKLTPTHIDQWLNYLLEYRQYGDKPLAGKTISDLYFLLKLLLDYAVKIELIEKNPCDRVDPPKYAKKEADFYNLEELNLMLNELLKLDDERYLPHKTYVFLDLFTGLRGAELDGLEWSDIDFNSKRLGVKENRRYVHEFGVVVGAPKTDKSERDVTIPQTCLDLLCLLLDQQKNNKELLGDKWVDSGYVFVNRSGQPYHPRSIAKWFPDFLISHGLRRITLHKLRHTHVSLLNYLEVNMEEISRRIGHADSNITRKTYTHIFKDNSREIADKLDGFFGGFPQKNDKN